MAVQLTADRRWVMTGTPTPATATGSGASYLQPLLAFLHQEPFGSSRSTWEACVSKPLEAGAAAVATAVQNASADGCSRAHSDLGAAGAVADWGRQQLMTLLARVMIRSCKADLALLPPCYKKVTLLDFAPDHAASYNALVEVIRRNLLLADWCDDAHKESLLNIKQSRWAKEMLGNIRLACCVAGAMNLVPKDEDVLETIELLAGRLELPQPAKDMQVFATALPAAAGANDADEHKAAVAAETGSNHQAGEMATQHIGNAQTAAATAAPGANEVDTAATAAAGVGNGSSEAVDDAPADTIPATAASSPNAAAAAAASTSGVVLRQRWFYTGPGHPLHRVEEGLRQGCACEVCGVVTHLPMITPCAHLMCTDCTATSRTGCPVCGLAYTMQARDDPARYGNNPNPKWEVPLDVIEWQPVYHQEGATGVSGGAWSANWRITRSTKVLHLLRRLNEIGIYAPAAARQHHQASSNNSSGSTSFTGQSSLKRGNHDSSNMVAAAKPVAVKAIVFSQFWMHVQLIAAELAARNMSHVLLKRDMSARDKQAAVTTFRATPSSSCLVMDESGALGLDLSFVRYIFLMEPIADAALEQQVVSRAHRMGAVAPVHVEVLAMRHTAEEHLVALRHQAASGRLNGTAADAAATHAAAAVAGASSQPWLTGGQQQQQQQDDLGGATAAAAAVDISNITNFVAVGCSGNQLDNRGLRNLVLLHLKKVAVGDLHELHEHHYEAANDGFREHSRQQRPDVNECNILWSGAAAAVGEDGDAEIGGNVGLWSDYAVRSHKQKQRQQRKDERDVVDIGDNDSDQEECEGQAVAGQQRNGVQQLPWRHQQQQPGARTLLQAAAGGAAPGSAQQEMKQPAALAPQATATGAFGTVPAAAAPSRSVKRARFADDV
eukprot:GHRR01006123.1.p1 GENE.GHRR01006123.1~~GHRR01006123.1.p1  ORF type:complete len:1000 (+),score=452.54 GHRR01006123.1:320-3001(+)